MQFCSFNTNKQTITIDHTTFLNTIYTFSQNFKCYQN